MTDYTPTRCKKNSQVLLKVDYQLTIILEQFCWLNVSHVEFLVKDVLKKNSLVVESPH